MSYDKEGKIIDVYEENLLDEIRKISELIEDYPFISMVKYIFKYSGYRISRNNLPSQSKFNLHYKEY
jgi:hypothetical protein